MLAPRLKSEVDNLWSLFWTAGVTNPLTAVEQITYLLFLKRLDDLNQDRTPEASLFGPREECKLAHHVEDYAAAGVPVDYKGCPGHHVSQWSFISGAVYTEDVHQLLTTFVFPWLRELEETIQEKSGSDEMGFESAHLMSDAYFQLPREKTETLKMAIQKVDQLFRHVDTQGASGDVLGDLFEYLLNEIQQSGMNGQFRTPRHIIRFMVELLDPQPEDRICDPAAGTGGFLINSIIHLRRRATERQKPDDLRLEWDGTPLRTVAGGPDLVRGDNLVGFDNDRTMVRVGWMNLILHGIRSPRFQRRDALSQSFTEREQYDKVFANPPFTGKVDTSDLHPTRFVGAGAGGAAAPRSEILFVWLILDLLKERGRAAVIVPEGVLYGGTNAHVRLRQHLLLEHQVQGVISLPAGVFQPYTGVKTSILVFQKVGSEGKIPCTDTVWFYEVLADGRTPDAKRDPRPAVNDLWDALEKWGKDPRPEESLTYYRPELWMERWRVVDEKTRTLFSEEVPVARDGSALLGIHELFPELSPEPGSRPVPPAAMDARVQDEQRGRVRDLFLRHVNDGLADASGRAARQRAPAKRASAAKRAFQDRIRGLAAWFEEGSQAMLEQHFEPHAQRALRIVVENARADMEASLPGLVEEALDPARQHGYPAGSAQSGDGSVASEAAAIVRSFARLDGYNIQLRSLKVEERDEPLEESRCWTAPVRRFINVPEWTSEDGTLRGSHDETGTIRPEFLADPRIYVDAGPTSGKVRVEYLDPDCIEANDYNLGASRYKPYQLRVEAHAPPQELLERLVSLEKDVLRGLQELTALVRGPG